jgi:hypothetical protein
MKSDPFEPDAIEEDTLPLSWLEALRELPSEQGEPSGETDEAILNAAKQKLANIRQHKRIQRFWPFLATAACLAFALTLLYRFAITSDRPEIASGEDKYALILREVSAVFPQQVKAIFADGEGSDLKITLADEPLSSSDQAVVIDFCAHGNCTAVITYVGQTVEINEHRVTVRTDENGNLVIDSPDSDSTYHIKTRRI